MRHLAAVVLLSVLYATPAGAAPPAPRETPAWNPKLYAFCIEQFDAKKRSLADQAEMVRRLGFDGVGYPLWLDENLSKNLRVLDEAGLEVDLLYVTLNVDASQPPYDPRLPEAIRRLRGRPVTVAVLLRGYPPADPRGDARAVAMLRELGEVAGSAGVRISIYHHTGDWTESFLHALAVAKKVDHPQVGVNFNLCHWLKIEGKRDFRPALRAGAGKIFAVTINGAAVGSSTWTNGLIQPLDRGDFDVRGLLAAVRESGYRGPIGLMCYGIPGDAQEHLERSMRVWRQWKAEAGKP